MCLISWRLFLLASSDSVSDHPGWTEHDEALELFLGDGTQDREDSEDEVSSYLRSISLSSDEEPGTPSDDDSHSLQDEDTKPPPQLRIIKWNKFVDRVFDELALRPPAAIDLDDEAYQQFITHYRAFVKKSPGSLPSIALRRTLSKAWGGFKDGDTQVLSPAANKAFTTWLRGVRLFSTEEWERQVEAAQAHGGKLPPDGHLFFKVHICSLS